MSSGGAVLWDLFAALPALTWHLSCPAHCHPSVVPPFLSGITVGLCLGGFLGFWASWTFLTTLAPGPSTSDLPSRPRPQALHLARLRAYVHE